MEQVKRKRGRPKKVKLPNEILSLVDDTLLKSEAGIGLLSVKETNIDNNVETKGFKWDVPIDLKIDFFDSTLSYEITGYRPITQTSGLDFDPNWFTEARDTYKRTGHYCEYRFKSKPYNDFWAEQYRRCRNGYTVNGYTITGDNYFFLNFYTLPIVDKNQKSGAGTKDGFPTFFVSQYTFFHYFEMAKRLHLHCALMKARSIGFSEINAAIATNMFITTRQSFTIITCYDEKKLKRTYRKFTHALTFLDSKTDGGMFRLRQIEDSALTKTSGRYENKNGQKIPTGFQSTVSGVNGNDPSNIRGDRVDLIIYDEAGCHAKGTEVVMYDGTLKKVEDIEVGDVLMGDDGTPRNVLELHSGKLLMYKIIPKVGDTLIVNANHILYGKHRDYYRKTYEPFTIKTEDYYNMVTNNPRKKDGYKLVHSNLIKFPHQNVIIDPYLFGFWLGDGDSAKARFTSEDLEIITYLTKYGEQNGFIVKISECTNSKKCKHITFTTLEYKNKFCTWLKLLGVFNNKHIPDCYLYNDENTLLLLLAGIVDSDGTYDAKKHRIQITQYEGRKHLIDLIEYICHLLGMRVSRDVRISKERKLNGKIIKGGVKQYIINILWGHSRIPTKLPRKLTNDRDCSKIKSLLDRLYSTFTILKLDIDEYYGFSLDGNLLFLLKDFTVCHNSWPDLTTAVILGQELVEVQGIPRGIMMFGGTGGDKGKNLEGLRTIYYDPEAFKVLPYRHNYSQTGESVITAFFIPYFALSLDPAFMDKRGVVNEQKFKEVLQEERNKLAKIPKEYVKKCAERCWNAEEAFNLEGDNKFNKTNIAELLANIRALKKCPPIERGYIEYKFKDGAHILQNIDGFKWIINLNSKLLILEHPIWTLPDKKDESGNVVWKAPKEKIRNLYVIGIDGIDIGAAQTSLNTKDPSDFCLVVYKRAYGLEEPKFVALYKDRPNDIRECYKIAIKLALYYNAIINIEATRQSIIPYARERKLLNLFMRRPRATLSESIRNTNKQYGTPATPAIIDHQTDLIADYINDYCHLVWFEEMLDEFNRYTDENKRKFDIVASVAMALLADEELQGTIPKIVEEVKDSWVDIGFYTDEYGRRRYGVLPNNKLEIRFNNNFGYSYDNIGPRTSDPRIYSGYLS